MTSRTRDHGGDIDRARAEYGGTAQDWIDLSTGINRRPYPLPDLPDDVWRALPTAMAEAALVQSARLAYGTDAPILPLAGAQAAIQMIPRLLSPGRARVLGPTYNEHAASLRAAGWHVEDVYHPDALAGADLAVIVNPNNPDGRVWSPEEIMELRGSVGTLVVDESFADALPEVSVASEARDQGLWVLRSFGKFYGLAGVRLGFVLGYGADLDRLRDMAGPWSVSGPALEIGRKALADLDWAAATRPRLIADAARLDDMVAATGWTLVGGTPLFRTYEVGNAVEVQASLARSQIWTRVFPYAPGWIRLGLPGTTSEWDRLTDALSK